ncbi:hypothetical protein C464_16092 [Halorubrum coriense DSM 10284]|uniref:Uncharacterized protein n=1 Tax=Halorubrum coriense DSM 10284 TaxID=1227466 RepID=M0E9F4_9EURY|nr:hypothetical protein C464_16092 [Halorubrum coriense DSM 10284]
MDAHLVVDLVEWNPEFAVVDWRILTGYIIPVVEKELHVEIDSVKRRVWVWRRRRPDDGLVTFDFCVEPDTRASILIFGGFGACSRSGPRSEATLSAALSG